MIQRAIRRFGYISRESSDLYVRRMLEVFRAWAVKYELAPRKS